MKTFRIYYHNDMDGMCSRVIAEKIIEKRYKSVNDGIEDYKLILDTIEAYELSHSATDFDKISAITGDEELVIFVDYSFTENTLDIFKEILKKTDNGKRLLWIDHHDSSIKFVKNHIFQTDPEKIIKMPSENFVVSKAGSAAYLAWTLYQQYTFLNLKVDHDTLLQYYEVPDIYEMLKYVPPVVRHVSDYDTFEHRLPNTDEFKLGYDMELDKYAFMQKLFNFSGGWNSDELIAAYSDKWRSANECDLAIATGEIIMNYVTAENQTVIKRQGYESCIKDLETGQMEKVYVCNRLSNSWVFGELYNQYKYVVVYHFNGTEYKYSIFSNLKIFSDTDCEKYAIQFGGGGHKGAAGWRSEELMFLKDTFIFDGMESWMSSNIKSAANGCEAAYMDN